MKLVSEQIIDDLVDYYDSIPEMIVKKTVEYMAEYPVLLGFLEQESNHVLLDEEKDLQWYILIVCMSAIMECDIQIPEFSVEALTAAEENNWDILQQAGAGTWKDRLDPFFDDFPQEDLLAFVEDMVQDDEESPLTQIGKEVIFISVKSILDTVFEH